MQMPKYCPNCEKPLELKLINLESAILLCTNLKCPYPVEVIFTLLLPVFSGAASGINNLATDLENWMSNLPESLRNMPINHLAIPGSHDSFTNDITSKSDVSPDGEDILKKLQFSSIVKLVMANWSVTQAYNVLEQLQAGIRYFDLRICKNYDNNKLRFCHGMYSTKVTSVMQDILVFLNGHPKEVVILDCQHFYNFTDTIHLELIHYFYDTFGEKLIPYQSNMDFLTLANLTNQRKQVLLVYRNSNQNDHQALLWPDESFPTPWYNTMNSKYLISSLEEGLASRTSNTGYISQLILTPNADNILLNLLTSLKQKCAIEFQSTRSQWISNQTPAGKNGVNVIIGDFVDLGRDAFTKAVINLNLKLLETDTSAGHRASFEFNIFRFVIPKIAKLFSI
ncbi:unnamed protein product [Ceutorhynchus assimilis]|uniref:Phosphatidylinositol-specific phospholipase C X domain-containing protein n=1 Tax=Ceutorhynchus assimilis TaxID=467358 RepID=A0A9P0GS74_9CUCU|nr:unnamed protein product [Ceutorhynchus assimilis]